MFGAKTQLKDAEKTKILLIQKNILSENYHYIKSKTHIIFPLKKKIKSDLFELVEQDFQEKKGKPGNLKDLLKGKLTEKEIEKLKRAYDTIGTIAILEIDEEFREKEKIIAHALINSNPNIKTVLRKAAGHVGTFRTQKMKWLAGEKTKESIHAENGVKIKLDVEKVYFSPRLSTERKRISELVKKGENVLVMFSGCAPFPCVISKNSQAKEIMGIEINPEGHKYGVQNALLNKLKNIILINGDVKKDVPMLAKKGLKFERIVMPAPHNAESFIEEALMVAKKRTIIHYYDFLHEDNFVDAEKKIDLACKKNGRKWKKIALVKCGQHAPRTYRICLDFEVIS